MTKTRMLFIIGVFIAILPYLGFPANWKNFLFTLFGLGLALFAYMLRREAKAKNTVKETFDNFSENSDFDPNSQNKEN